MSKGFNDLYKELNSTQSLIDKLNPSISRHFSELGFISKTLLETDSLTQYQKMLNPQASSITETIRDYELKQKKQMQQLLGYDNLSNFATKSLSLDMISELATKTLGDLQMNHGYILDKLRGQSVLEAHAHQHLSNFDLLNAAGISQLSHISEMNQFDYASSLINNLNSFKFHNLIIYEDPEPEEIDNLDLDDIEIEEEQKSSLIMIDKLPLKVISMILQNPQEVRNITPRQFEEFIADLLSQLGFSNVILTPRSGDGGKDIIASRSISGIPISLYFECKKYADGNKIQLETLRALLGTMAHDARSVNKGVLVTTSSFTRGCNKFIMEESRLDGKDYQGILGWINEINKNHAI